MTVAGADSGVKHGYAWGYGARRAGNPIVYGDFVGGEFGVETGGGTGFEAHHTTPRRACSGANRDPSRTGHNTGTRARAKARVAGSSYTDAPCSEEEAA